MVTCVNASWTTSGSCSTCEAQLHEGSLQALLCCSLLLHCGCKLKLQRPVPCILGSRHARRAFCLFKQLLQLGTGVLLFPVQHTSGVDIRLSCRPCRPPVDTPVAG